MNLNLRHNKDDKNAYKYLSEDKILELEKIKANKQLEGEELFNYKLTKWLVSGAVSLFIAMACILPLGLKINDTIKNIYMVKYNYVIIDNNIIKKEDTKQTIKEYYYDQFIYRLTENSLLTKENIEKIINSLKETK